MKIIGVIFVILSAGSVGFQMAAALRRKSGLLRELEDALRLMRSEIDVYGTPLPQVFAAMAASTDGTLEALFSCIAKDMDANRWVTPSDAVRLALQNVEDDNIGSVLLPLSKMLGKYDIEAQLQGINSALLQTSQKITDLEQERKLKSKTYRTLGICAGLAVAILLL